MKIIDDFLSPSDFKLTQNFFFSENFPWYFCDTITGPDGGLDQYQFTHTFFSLSQPFDSNYSNFLQPILTKLNAKYILRIKANLRPRTTQGVLSPFHTDMKLNQQTAIFYLNTNNGYTKFHNDTYPDVPSVANRLLTFYGGLKHTGSSCTDQNTRIVLNINYIPS